MDIISYGTASKANKEEKETRNNILGEGVEGSFSTVEERINNIDEAVGDVTKQADHLIIKNSINIMKSHAKLNAIAKTKKYNMHNMVFDDLLDLSGIDTTKSSGYIHDEVNGEIAAEADCVLETKEEIVDVVPKKAILTVEENRSVKPMPIFSAAEKNVKEGVTISATYNNSSIFRMFDLLSESGYWSGPDGSQKITIDFGSNPKIINGYTLFGLGATSAKDWIFKASKDGVNYTLLDSQVGITGTLAWDTETWGSYGEKKVSLSNNQAFRFYQLELLATNGYSQYRIPRFDLTQAIYEISGRYFISRDNGTTWESITPDTLFYFNDTISPLDNKIRLKAKLPSGTKLLNYSLTWA